MRFSFFFFQDFFFSHFFSSNYGAIRTLPCGVSKYLQVSSVVIKSLNSLEGRFLPVEILRLVAKQRMDSIIHQKGKPFMVPRSQKDPRRGQNAE